VRQELGEKGEERRLDKKKKFCEFPSRYFFVALFYGLMGS